MKPPKRSKEQQRFWLELRRSNAASPHRDKTRYRRKKKHKHRDDED